MNYAPLSLRIEASFIDGIVIFLTKLAILAAFFVNPWSDAATADAPINRILNLALFCGAIGYRWIPLKIYGATLGMNLRNIQMVDESGRPLGWKAVILRSIYAMVSGLALGVGYLVAIRDDRNQTWHDRWARTLVVMASSKGGMKPKGKSALRAKPRVKAQTIARKSSPIRKKS